MGMTTIENGKSSADNLKEIAWVQQQTKEELNTLTNNVESNFYEKGADGTVTYKMDLVKQYLNSIKGKTWKELVSKNSSAWIMAVQISLESMGYDVGKVDGLLGKVTADAVRKFQADKGLKVDGAPGPDTIAKILVSLEGGNGKVEETDEQKLEKVKAKKDAKVEKGGKVKAEELVEGVQEGVQVSLKDGQEIKTDTTGEIKVVVVVKVGDKVKEIEVVVKVVEKAEIDKDKLEKVKARENVKVEKGGKVKAEELVEGVEEGVEVSLKEGQEIKTDETGKIKVIVVVKVGNEVKEIEVTVEIVLKEELDKEKIEKVKAKENKKVKVGEEVKPEDLVDDLPEGGTVELPEGEKIDTSKEGKVEVTVIVKVGNEVRKIRVVIIVEVGHVEKTDDQKLDAVKAKKDAKVEKGGKVIAKELVEGVEEGVEVSLKEGQEIKTDTTGEIKVIVVVKVGDKVKEIEVVVRIVEKEELDKEKINQVKGKELVEIEVGDPLDSRDLVENLPEGAEVRFKQGLGENIGKVGEYKVIVIVKVGNEVREFEIIVRVVEKKEEKPDDKDNKDNKDDKTDKDDKDDKTDKDDKDDKDNKDNKDNKDDKGDRTEKPDDDAEKYRELKYGKLSCAKVEGLRNGSELVIKSREELRKFGPNLYNKYDDNYFRYHSLALKYDQRTNTADKGLAITSVTRIPGPMFGVDVKYKDLSIPGSYGGAMMGATECLFVEINKNEENNVKWENENPAFR